MTIKTYKYKIVWCLKYGKNAGKQRIDYNMSSNADVAKRKFKKEIGGGSDVKLLA